MKAMAIVLKPKEIKALSAIIDRMKLSQTMMQEGAHNLRESEKQLWDILNSLYPTKSEQNRSFDLINFELKYFEAETDEEKYRSLKEAALREHDFEKATKYRELERKEKEKKG